ncbi:MAG: hypothetical protein RLZZ164_619 [Actinomycetota bacterium]|jgi:PAS domain-containing protein
MSQSPEFNQSVSQSTWDAWAAELESIGFTNPLRNFERNIYGQIDLSSAHPGGFSQFVGAKQTTLSNLVRDEQSFMPALAAARRLKQKSDQLAAQLGLDTLGLLGGLLNLQADGLDLQLPIFVWPIHLNHRADDFEIELAGPARVNPVLTAALKSNYNISLNTGELLSLAAASTEIMPRSVIDYLESVLASVTGIQVQRLLVITTFTSAAFEASSDFDHSVTSVIARLANPTGYAQLGNVEDRDFTLVADADQVQRRIVSRALAGQSFAVETLPGCGYTQTVLNTIAALVESGKRVVVAAPRVQTLGEVADRFAALGLPGFAVRSKSAWLDLVSAISRNEKAQLTSLEKSKQDVALATEQLSRYQASLAKVDQQFGFSIGDALEALARLSGMPKAPQTRARIEKQFLGGLSDRTQALEVLSRAEHIGVFKVGPKDSPWFAARLGSPEEIQTAVALAKRLRDVELVKLREQMTDFVEKSKFVEAKTVDDWGVYLKLLLGIRETLDRFVPDVFDRPLTELITATSARKEAGVGRSEMSGTTRRRLKRLAKEYLRPGMHVSDLNSSLRQIQEQRDQWHLLTTSVAAPTVPLGLNDAQVLFQKFVNDLDQLQQYLDPEVCNQALSRVSLNELQNLLNGLADGVEVLDNYGEQQAVLGELKALGLAAFARDLAGLHPKREELGAELDLAWWQSVLEILIQRDSTVMQFKSQQLDELEADFAKADATLVERGAEHLAWLLADRWHAALGANAGLVDAFKQTLKAGGTTLMQVFRAARPIYEALAPVVLVSPFEATRELYGQKFDVALILDAAGTTVSENLAVIKRADQAIFFGDDAIAAAQGFDVECHIRPLSRTAAVDSAYQVAKAAFGVETLRVSYRPFGQVLATLINREFYQGRIVFEPTADEFDGKRSHSIEIITEGAKANTTASGATESPEAEVRRVVDLVLNHALWHPEQSLFVASASLVHAERIRTALAKELKAKPDLATFFDSHGREKFEVVSISELAHRVADRIIFSVGFGLNPGGSVSNDFGLLSHSEGRRFLTNTLVSARRQITVVSCMSAASIPVDVADGARLLRTLLESAEDGGYTRNDLAADSLLGDLASRLRRLGARVDTGFAERLPLVVAYANTKAVVMPDSALLGSNLTEKFRLRPNLLRSLGFEYIRVHSFELFADPASVASQIAGRLRMPIAQTSPKLFESDRAFEDTDMAWGDRPTSNDDQLRRDIPPHY